MLLLSSTNVGDYLVRRGLCAEADKVQLELELIKAKNFNLKVRLPDGTTLLVKQERCHQVNQTVGEFHNEWRVQAFMQHFPELAVLRSHLPVALYFDPEHAIMVLHYLEAYRDLAMYDLDANRFPTALAHALGALLAKLHRTTLEQPLYEAFLAQNRGALPPQMTDVVRYLQRIGPEIFGLVPDAGLRFLTLYQRFESLGQAMTQLAETRMPCCLIHNDLKLNNILVHTDWETTDEPRLRFIDWERATWGDPADDLGMLLSGYLRLWLDSLVVSQALSIEDSLRLATTPIEQLQPSTAALVQAYLATFPAIVERRPDFPQRVVQSAGFGLIQQILSTLHYQKTFGNIEIAILQVAKTLLCRPDHAMETVFGTPLLA